ncbi:MAG: (2Fe-2S) ferredoxin domain-containing protein [gamma proteobacterium endosymbiont of Lamellibrachia anaximandri]|nr:(2Fe-2S) ferredoxin domain-containing protein [gamma proteobacterium endosymbiont of Lamellibrachia anaximandri]MBL3534383.1 (2Fe-2S) ferredoxin domain-containing protein [gamma proteobacterium endosymbiont of Lamellibrachia anaximandri]MBL3599566.1 (2Fe-2S) ferredoxin domain-containing protein [gamma proteobacterium endosymbiont of Lamellibrachia anaximandri]
MSYYRHHLFFCTNQRDDGRRCCARFNVAKMRGYLKTKVKALGLAGPGGIRINTAGCLDRCDKGPVIVVYPEAVWYTYIDSEDLDEILQRHLIDGEVVERLRIR